MTVSEIATALRRRGGSHTEKQVRATVARAEELGQLKKRGRTRWDVPSEVQQSPVAHPLPPAVADLFVECASRLLDLDSDGEFHIAIRVLLRAARTCPHAQHPVPSPTAAVAKAREALNGAAKHVHREIEIREPTIGA
jgi:hypothetical protein